MQINDSLGKQPNGVSHSQDAIGRGRQASFDPQNPILPEEIWRTTPLETREGLM